MRAAVLLVLAAARADELSRLGHDDFALPAWIHSQMADCACAPAARPTCAERGAAVDWRAATHVTFCVAKSYLLERMPAFDLQFLPASVTVNGTSMLDDNVAFALMARARWRYAAALPARLYLAYVLPYASYHEARANWRPLLYAKHRDAVSASAAAAAPNPSTADAGAARGAPNRFRNGSGNAWPGARAAPRAPRAGRSSGPRAPRRPSWRRWTSSRAEGATALAGAARTKLTPAPALPRKVRLRLVLGVGDVRDVLAARGRRARAPGRHAVLELGLRRDRLPRARGRQRERLAVLARRRRRDERRRLPEQPQLGRVVGLGARGVGAHERAAVVGRGRHGPVRQLQRREGLRLRGIRRVRERRRRAGRGDARPRDLRDDVGRRRRRGRRVGPAGDAARRRDARLGPADARRSCGRTSCATRSANRSRTRGCGSSIVRTRTGAKADARAGRKGSALEKAPPNSAKQAQF